MLIKSENKWVDAKVMKVFEYENRQHLKLKAVNSNIELEIPAYDRSVRTADMYIKTILKNNFTILGRHKRSISNTATIGLPNEFENTLLDKLVQVIDSINHEIDSSHNFLFQVYHVDILNEYKMQAFITYEYHD
eukprot:26812_1